MKFIIFAIKGYLMEGLLCAEVLPSGLSVYPMSGVIEVGGQRYAAKKNVSFLS